MNALLMPGNSKRHSEWIEQLKEALSPLLDTTKTQHYRHWQTGEEFADVDYEIAVAKLQATELEPYIIVGKSIGTVIAAKGTSEKKLKPAKLVLMGIPINGGVSVTAFAKWLDQINTQIIIVQNTDDPLGSFSDVISGFGNTGDHISFIELSGGTHDYLDFKAIAKLI